MEHAALAQLLTELIATWESEVVEFTQATRADVNQLLLPKLSEALTDVQKDNKISNLLTSLRRGGRIRNAGTRGQPI